MFNQVPETMVTNIAGTPLHNANAHKLNSGSDEYFTNMRGIDALSVRARMTAENFLKKKT
jgi:hypothetical protein